MKRAVIFLITVYVSVPIIIYLFPWILGHVVYSHLCKSSVFVYVLVFNSAGIAVDHKTIHAIIVLFLTYKCITTSFMFLQQCVHETVVYACTDVRMSITILSSRCGLQ